MNLSDSSSSQSQISTHVSVSELFYKQCCQIQALRFYSEWTYSKIAEVLEIPLATVWHVCKSPATPVKRKNKVLVTTPIRKHLVFKATKNATNRRKSYCEIARSIGLKLSKHTARRAFEKEGYHCRAARKKPLLTERHKAKRLEYAQAYLHMDEWDWCSVLFTDEYYIWMREA
jgi:Transposase